MPSVINRSPLVSVVIPSYNSARFVLQALQSVRDQTYDNYEIIVVDDGSTDETKRLLSGQPVIYRYQKNQGAAAARNAGIKAARGDFICFLDADDFWPSNKLALQLRFLERHPEVGLLSGRSQKFNENGAPYAAFEAKEDRASAARIYPAPAGFVELVKTNFVGTSAVMIRKECFEKAGLFDVALIPVEDRDLWLRISTEFGVAQMPVYLCKKRLHNANVSADKQRMLRTRIKVLEKNRALFPGFAPSRLWNRCLAKTYLKVGFLSLSKNQMDSARQESLRSLSYSLRPKAIALLIATFMGPWAARMLLGRRKRAAEIGAASSTLN